MGSPPSSRQWLVAGRLLRIPDRRGYISIVTFNSELFDQVAARYDEKPPFFQILGKRLVDFARLPSGSSVLDIGAGRGAVTFPSLVAVGPSGRVTAIDVSPNMLNELQAHSIPNLTLRLEDVSSSNLPDASHDHAVSGFTLHILSEPRAALEQVARVLRPGGTLSWSKPGTHPAAQEWEDAYGQIFSTFSRRLTSIPTEMTDQLNEETIFESVGFEVIDQTVFSLELSVGGPAEYWDWTQTHGARWLTDQLSSDDAAEFKNAVIQSLQQLHPTRGQDIMVAPILTRCRLV